jgi:hypothetical protein
MASRLWRGSRNVRFFQSCGDLRTQRRCFLFTERAGFDFLCERQAGNALHDEIIGAALLSDVVNGGDIRMIELGERESFPAKATAGALVD